MHLHDPILIIIVIYMPLASALCYMLRESCSLVDLTMSLAANVLKTTLAASVSQQLHGACFK